MLVQPALMATATAATVTASAAVRDGCGMLASSTPHFLDQKMPCLIEILGPQHSGKTSIADLVALILEENAAKCLRVEEDSLIHTFFPAYVKMRSTGQKDKAHDFLNARRPFLTDVSSGIIRRGLDAGYTVIHDHITKHKFRQGVCSQVAKDANAGYLSVFVTAPLDMLEGRWAQREPDEQRIRELEETYQRLQALRDESQFILTIDTAKTCADEAAKSIVSRIYPHMNVNVLELVNIKHAQKIAEPPAYSKDQTPLARLENVQLVRVKDALVIINRHKRFVIEEAYLKMLQLLDGKNTVEHIAAKTGSDLNKVQKFVQFLSKEKMVA